jgi:DNA-binding IclR family transcriptional regulator
MLEALFGSVCTTQALLYLQNYGDGDAKAVAAAFRMSPAQARRQLHRLEDGGLLISRPEGRTRVYVWNHANPLVVDLRRLLQTALGLMSDSEQRTFFRERGRPKRAGVPIST